jgi:hypothetical protein
MIFVIDEDGGLLVFENEMELRRELEEVDVVSAVYSMFAEDGSALAVVQDPSQLREGWRKFVYGPFTGYSLQPAVGGEHQMDLFALESEIRYLDENPHFRTIAEVMSFARSRRAASV